MTFLRIFLSLSILALNSTAFADDGRIHTYFKSSTFLYSEPVSLKTIRNDWQGKYWNNGEKQIGKSRTEAGVTNGKWSFAGIYREDYYINFTTDTADLYYGVENNQPIDRTTPYKLSLDAYRYRGKGLQVKRAFSFSPSLHANIGLNLFKASNLLDGNLEGQAEATASDSYDFQIDVNSQYAEDPLFDRQLDDTVSGTGLALDADITWQVTPELRASLKAEDIAGFIRWKNVPFTSSEANSNNVTVNDTGFTQVNPILSGVEGYNSHFTQSLKPSVEGTVRYAFKEYPYAADVTLKHYDGLNLFGVGLEKPNRYGGVRIKYWPAINTAELNISHKRIGFTLAVDNIDVDNIRTAWLSLSYGMD